MGLACGDSGTPLAQRAVLFVHVMKTGGMTLLTHLQRTVEPEELYPNPELDMAPDISARVAFRHMTIDHLEKVPEQRRRRLRVICGHFPYAARDVLGGDLDVITLLRHPVDRTISLLRQLQRPSMWDEGASTAGTRPPALEAIYERTGVYEPLIHDHQTKIFSMTLEDRPTGYLQVIEVDRTRLALAKENLERVEVLGLTERYNDFLDRLRDRYGWHVKRDARVNAAPDDGARVTRALRRRITEDNAIDMELYDFATELVAARRARPTG